MQCLGICRFSLLGRGDWIAFRGGTAAEIEASIADQARLLFEPQRLAQKFQSFERVTLASLAAQSDQDFTFLVLASEMMAEADKQRLSALCAQLPQVRLSFHGISTAPQAQRREMEALGLAMGDLLQFRLDDDDGLSRDYIAKLKQAARAAGPEPTVFTNDHCYYALAQAAGRAVYHWPVRHLAAGLGLRHPQKSIFEFSHFNMGRIMESVILPDCPALVSHTGANDTTFSEARAKRRGMIKLAEAEIGRLLAHHFPPSALEFLLPAQGGGISEPAPAPAPEAAPEPARVTARVTAAAALVQGDCFKLSYQKGSDILFVGFDNLAGVRNPDPERAPWGQGFAQGRGWGYLGVQVSQENWFRHEGLIAALTQFAQGDEPKRYRKIVLSGTSMGGYGAIAFSPLFESATVIAYAPQSSLDAALVPWERRYPQGMAQDWSGAFGDAAQSVDPTRKIYVIYDPFVREDRLHAQRLVARGAFAIRTRWAGHQNAQFLRLAGLLARLSHDCAMESLDLTAFYRSYRALRESRRYAAGMMAVMAHRKSLNFTRQALRARALRRFPIMVRATERECYFSNIMGFDAERVAKRIAAAAQRAEQKPELTQERLEQLQKLNTAGEFALLEQLTAKFASTLYHLADFHVWRANALGGIGQRKEVLNHLLTAFFIDQKRSKLQERLINLAKRQGRRDVLRWWQQSERLPETG